MAGVMRIRGALGTALVLSVLAAALPCLAEDPLPSPTPDAPVEEGPPPEPPAQESAPEAVETVSAETEGVLWMEDDLRQSLARAAAICGDAVPAWPERRFDRVSVAPPMESGRDVLRGMQGARDPVVRLRALESLGASGTAQDLEACLGSLLDPVPGVRQAAAEAVARLCGRAGNMAAAEQLLTRIYDVFLKMGPQQQMAVDLALPRWSEALGPAALTALTAEGLTEEQRSVAAYCLGRMRYTQAEDTLARLAREGEEVLSREAARALYQMRSAGSTPLWVELARHADEVVQRIAVEALAAQADDAALDALTPIALGQGGHPPMTQVLATHALATWPQRAAVPRLIDVMERNPLARQYAAARLRLMTGLAMSDSVVEWRTWWETGELPEGVRPPRRRKAFDVELM